MTLSSVGFEVFVPKGGILLTGDTTSTPLNYSRNCGWPVSTFSSLHQEANRQKGVIKPAHQEERGLLLDRGQGGEWRAQVICLGSSWHTLLHL